MGKVRYALFSIGLMTAVAVAQPLVETEPNDTPATANFIDDDFYPFGAVAIDGNLCDPDAADYFSFSLTAGDVITVSAFSLAVGGDPALTVLRPDLTTLAANDDAFGLNPFLGTTVDATGTHYVAVTDGGAGVCFDYKMAFAINPIPEPATFGLLALGLVGLIGRRVR